MAAGGKINVVGQCRVIIDVDVLQVEDLAPLADPAVRPDRQLPGEMDVYTGSDDEVPADRGTERDEQSPLQTHGPGKRGLEEGDADQDPDGFERSASPPVERVWSKFVQMNPAPYVAAFIHQRSCGRGLHRRPRISRRPARKVIMPGRPWRSSLSHVASQDGVVVALQPRRDGRGPVALIDQP